MANIAKKIHFKKVCLKQDNKKVDFMVLRDSLIKVDKPYLAVLDGDL